MKKLLFLFLFLLPCFAWAQYPSNGNQKITLGEQTSADGLIWRGVASDTTLTAKSDTAAYFVLDTVNINLYTYKASATGRKWRQLGADTASIAYVNTYGTQTVNGAKTFTSVLTGTRFDPTANTVTGNGMYLPATNSLGFSTAGTQRIHINSSGKVGINTQMTTANNFGLFNVAGLFTFETSFYALRSNGTTDDYAEFFLRESGAPGNYGTGETGQLEFSTYSSANTIGALVMGNLQNRPVIFGTSNLERVRLKGDGEMNIGYGTTDNGAYRLQVKDSVYVGGNVSASAYTTRSDFNLKDDILDLKYGLNDVLKLQPVEYTYKSNGSKQLGFIAQDIGTILPEVVSFEESMSVNYQAIIPILTKAIQQQQAQIEALKQRLLILENK
jgi:hypothetical protein